MVNFNKSWNVLKHVVTFYYILKNVNDTSLDLHNIYTTFMGYFLWIFAAVSFVLKIL